MEKEHENREKRKNDVKEEKLKGIKGKEQSEGKERK